MQETIISLAVVVLLFAAAFITSKKFGLLALALAAGSILSNIWGYTAGLMIGALGIQDTALTRALTLSVIILLPAVVLFFHGARYKTTFSRVVGAALFTILALAFLVYPLSTVLSLQGIGLTAFNWLIANKSVIIGGGLIIAILDIFTTKHASSSHDKKDKH